MHAKQAALFTNADWDPQEKCQYVNSMGRLWQKWPLTVHPFPHSFRHHRKMWHFEAIWNGHLGPLCFLTLSFMFLPKPAGNRKNKKKKTHWRYQTTGTENWAISIYVYAALSFKRLHSSGGCISTQVLWSTLNNSLAVLMKLSPNEFSPNSLPDVLNNGLLHAKWRRSSPVVGEVLPSFVLFWMMTQLPLTYNLELMGSHVVDVYSQVIVYCSISLLLKC